jgi:flagellar biosynthesis/type III secretory pathway M-ring protein FliF/YscJ
VCSSDLVRSLPFDRSVKDDMEKEKLAEAQAKQRETILALGAMGFFMLIVLAALFLVFRKPRKKVSLVNFKPMVEDQLVEQLVEKAPPQPAMEQDLTPEEEKREMVLTLAKNNPEEFALLLKTWLITSRAKE